MLRVVVCYDQIRKTIQKLAEDINSRQAVVNLWDSEKDMMGKESPCLNHIWVRARDNKVHMSATLRSNDMFAGYPENVLALRLLQERIRSRLTKEVYKGLPDHGFILGDLVIISHSAHIYEESWKQAQSIVDKYYGNVIHKRYDERGSFFIQVDKNKKVINMDYLSPDGEHVGSFSGDSALNLRDKLEEENVVGTPDHGMYLGAELAKAEIALKHGLVYEQDKEIKMRQLR